VNSQEALVAWTKWVLQPDYAAQYEWISPSGKRLVSRPTDSEEYDVTYSVFPGELPMEPGAWRVYLSEENEIRLTSRFSVR
jgi:hypothetical protein